MPDCLPDVEIDADYSKDWERTFNSDFYVGEFHLLKLRFEG
jgi:hypothetical protein